MGSIHEKEETTFYRTIKASEFSPYFTEGDLLLGHSEINGEYYPEIRAAKNVKVRTDCVYSPELILQFGMPGIIDAIESIPLVRGMLEKIVADAKKDTIKTRQAEQRALFQLIRIEIENTMEI